MISLVVLSVWLSAGALFACLVLRAFARGAGAPGDRMTWAFLLEHEPLLALRGLLMMTISGPVPFLVCLCQLAAWRWQAWRQATQDLRELTRLAREHVSLQGGPCPDPGCCEICDWIARERIEVHAGRRTR